MKSPRLTFQGLNKGFLGYTVYNKIDYPAEICRTSVCVPFDTDRGDSMAFIVGQEALWSKQVLLDLFLLKCVHAQTQAHIFGTVSIHCEDNSQICSENIPL